MKRYREKTLLLPLLLAAAVGWIAAAWTWTRPADPALAPQRDDPVVTVFLLDNGFHTDLAVPRAALMQTSGPLADAASTLAAGDWILIGWGDAKFYVDQSPISDRLPDGFRAFFRPGNPAVVMLDPEQADPRKRFAEDGRASLRLSRAGFEQMMRRVERSLALSDGRARIAAARRGDDARFFASSETFSIAYLCNHWSARVLNAGGLAVRPLRSVTSSEVMATARRADLDTAPAGD